MTTSFKFLLGLATASTLLTAGTMRQPANGISVARALPTNLRASTATSLAKRAGERPPGGGVRNIVLVHGALVDGSAWRGVYNLLTKDGYRVSIVQDPLTSLEDDIAATRRVLERQAGPVVLVGQSYGGAVITAAGTDPKVKALVYIAALQPDKGESCAELNARMPSASAPYLKASPDGFYYFPVDKFPELVAADVPNEQAAFMAASQGYMAGASFMGKLPAAAWHDKPSYAVVATEDKSVSPDLQRFMYKRAGAKITEVKASHAVYISHARLVADLIEEAARKAS